MVGFGKKLRQRQIHGWEEYYISYKMMKEKVKEFASHVQSDRRGNRKQVLREFSVMLDHQVEKIVLFLLMQQGQLASRLSQLADVREAAEDSEQGIGATQTSALQQAYESVGKDLLKLLQFVDMNATGLRKILKKFDKHVGYRLTDEYVASRSNHPYSQLQHIFRHVGIGAMVGTLSHNLAELQNHEEHIVTSVYEQSSRIWQDPLIESIRKAEDRLTNSTNFLRFLGNQALNERDDLPQLSEAEIEADQYHFMSLFLNLVNTFFYMVNTYIVVPTADKYAASLGAAPTVCGAIIGAMAVAQLVSSVYLSAWSNRSYLGPLIFSAVILCIGNVFYAIAYDFNSISILLLGRLLCGFGSARAVNRRYISDCVPAKFTLQASAAFVSASALGMATGPALAGLLEVHTSQFGITLNANTLPGWIMAGGWFLFLLWLWLGFKEPSHHDPITPSSHSSDINRGGNEWFKPLAIYSLDREDSLSDQERCQAATSISEAYGLLTPSVKVQLFIYFMLKFAMEILVSESSVVTAHYFQWSIHSVALFLALLGLTVLPVNWVIGSYASNIFQDRQLLVAAEILTCLGVLVSFDYGLMPYSVSQYISGALLMFISAEVLEGVNLSLLSKVMSSRLARGTYNGGLLSTEAGTVARVVADGTITLTGYFGESKLLNLTMLPTLVIGLLSIAGTLVTYNSMF
ncbi:unnamed protein product [Sphagnum troendelagicum]|uniref:SPX domain-containing protein n=1 Tax=Sphagnum troendelagicum TaxID=128251 RepID=A0ABP0UB68_9BRYO